MTLVNLMSLLLKNRYGPPLGSCNETCIRRQSMKCILIISLLTKPTTTNHRDSKTSTTGRKDLLKRVKFSVKEDIKYLQTVYLTK